MHCCVDSHESRLVRDGISDKFVFLDDIDPEEMVSSFMFAGTFPFPLCPSDEEGIKIAQNVMFKRCLVEKQCLNNTGVMKILFLVATRRRGWSLVFMGIRHIITPNQYVRQNPTFPACTHRCGLLPSRDTAGP